MLSTKVFKSATNATKYYQHADYYGAEAKGIWFGSGAEDFKLSGTFEAKTDQGFKDLIEGKMPDGRVIGNLDKHNNNIHRPGMDLTFSSPKSFSIQMHVLVDQQEKQKLDNARMKALTTTLSYIENSGIIYTRKGRGGKITEPISKLTYALFVHTTNRKLEPQDHVHCLLANATKCVDGKFRTIVWDDLLRQNKFIGQIFRNELALEVKKLGYEIRTTQLSDSSSSFELKHISQNLIDAFSTRRKEIEALFKLYDVKTKEGKDRIVINSREAKKTVPEKELKETWAKIADSVLNSKEKDNTKSLEITMSDMKQSALEFTRALLDQTIYKHQIDSIKAPAKLSVSDVIAMAVKDITYNESVFSKEELFKAALKHSIGEFGIRDIKKAIADTLKSNQIIKSDFGDNAYTSKELLEKEGNIIKISKRGLNKSSSIISPKVFDKRFAYHEQHNVRGYHLNNQQVNAVRHILTSKDKITAIQGLPGVGKSTVLETINLMSKDKIIALGAAPTASAAQTLEESSQIKSKTLHSFIGKYKGYLEGRGTKEGLLKIQQDFKKSVVFVDEASLVGTRQMNDLLNLSEILKFRVVLIGDTKQLSAVEAGKPFEQMLEVINSVKLTKIIRQKEGEHIKAIENVANNKILESFKIHEQNITGTKQFVSQAVKQYLSLSDLEQKNTILISPSREHRDKINNLIVKGLAETNKLGRTNHKLEVLKPVELKPSDFNFARNYKEGEIIKFNKDYKSIGIKKGDNLTVASVNQETNTLLFKHGIRNIRFQLKHNIDYTSKLEVFEKSTLDIREGLKLRITKNDQGLVNSETSHVIRVNAHNQTISLRLESNQEVTKALNSLKYVDYGYCATIHSSQGKTTDNLIAAICSHSKLNDQKSWLVSISRHKSNLQVYMQDKLEVQQQLQNNKGLEKSALDIKNISKEKQIYF
jgi:conjugative relaxase-like TrwC/TraI family protein